MKLSAMCIRCLIDRQEERIREFENENKKTVFMKEVAAIISSCEEYASAPYLVYRINLVYKRYFGDRFSYEKEKKEFNALMLSLEEQISAKIHSEDDREKVLKNAINYARTANYIDFGVSNHVSREKLLELLDKSVQEPLDEETYFSFTGDLDNARHLVYLTDNCGEIVADKLLIKVLKERNPNLGITVIVRGMPVLNDATMEDAEAVGLTRLVKVIHNGNGVAGTQITLLSDEARHALGDADLIISKGQGNFETIHGCGLNIYYLFLCKCEWFVKRFGLERLKGVFINEMRTYLSQP